MKRIYSEIKHRFQKKEDKLEMPRVSAQHGSQEIIQTYGASIRPAPNERINELLRGLGADSNQAGVKLTKDASLENKSAEVAAISSREQSQPKITSNIQNKRSSIIVQIPTEDMKHYNAPAKKIPRAAQRIDSDPHSLALTPSTSSNALEQIEAYQVLSSGGYLSFPKNNAILEEIEVPPTLYSTNPINVGSVEVLATTSYKSFNGLNRSTPSVKPETETIPPLPDRARERRGQQYQSSEVETDVTDIIQEAIDYHEASDYASAFRLYLQSAQEDLPFGMFLAGLSLRHGWGCQVDMDLALSCLEHSADHAARRIRLLKGQSVSPIDPSGVEAPKKDFPAEVLSRIDIARHEMAMALYELGQCYRFAWGVTKSEKTAVFYYQIAADLDEVDAQLDIAYCYMEGTGLKRNKYMAACYFRMAAMQGRLEFGNSWVYKQKYTNYFKAKFPAREAAEKKCLIELGSEHGPDDRPSKQSDPVMYLRRLKRMFSK